MLTRSCMRFYCASLPSIPEWSIARDQWDQGRYRECGLSLRRVREILSRLPDPNYESARKVVESTYHLSNAMGDHAALVNEAALSPWAKLRTWVWTGWAPTSVTPEFPLRSMLDAQTEQCTPHHANLWWSLASVKLAKGPHVAEATTVDVNACKFDVARCLLNLSQNRDNPRDATLCLLDAAEKLAATNAPHARRDAFAACMAAAAYHSNRGSDEYGSAENAYNRALGLASGTTWENVAVMDALTRLGGLYVHWRRSQFAEGVLRKVISMLPMDSEAPIGREMWHTSIAALVYYGLLLQRSGRDREWKAVVDELHPSLQKVVSAWPADLNEVSYLTRYPTFIPWRSEDLFPDFNELMTASSCK